MAFILRTSHNNHLKRAAPAVKGVSGVEARSLVGIQVISGPQKGKQDTIHAVEALEPDVIVDDSVWLKIAAENAVKWY